MKKTINILGALLIVAVMSITTTSGQQAGDIDTSWADSGWLIGGHIPDLELEIYKIQKISNNRFMLVGMTQIDAVDVDMLLIMYNADGTLFTDFGNQGVLRMDLSQGMRDGFMDFVELWDGKFLVAGASETDHSIDLVVVRLMADGSLDTSFGNNGVVRYDNAPGTLNFPAKIAVSSSNNIFVGAQIFDGTSYNLNVLKFTQGGGLDTNYGDNGIATLVLANSNEQFKGMHITDDEEVIVIGNINLGTGQRGFMFKLDAAGNFDTNWADGGSFVYNPSTFNYFNDLHVDAEGSVYVVGHHGEDYVMNGFVRKFEPNGLPDLTFATNGKLTMDIGDSNGIFYNNIKMKSDGNFVITGKAFGPTMNQIHAFTFDSAGSADCEFSCAGVYHDFTVDIYDMSQNLLEVMDDGSIITGGYFGSPDFEGQRIFLTKLLIENQIVSVFNPEIEKLQLTIYPNPTTSEMYIKNIENLEIMRVSLFALDGRMVQDWAGSQSRYPISSALPNGNYIARIASNRGASSQIITINR